MKNVFVVPVCHILLMDELSLKPEPELNILNKRNQIWITSNGVASSDSTVVMAHKQDLKQDETSSILEICKAFKRIDKENLEELTLLNGATKSKGAGNRDISELPDEFRTCFERDRDRILHSSAFRRLAGKTQVFIFPDDHQRTRLTHALEVAQIAKAIARSTRLNEALTEAIALGHDCGHGPGGHASEDALSIFMPEGFDHALFGANVTLAPLNLCKETIDGIANHSWSRPSPSTPEGNIVSWADRIAYLCHDFEDATRAGIVDRGVLPEVVKELCGRSRSQQISTFVNGVISTITSTGIIGVSQSLGSALVEFRKCNYENIYMSDDSVKQNVAIVKMLRALVEYYIKYPIENPEYRETQILEQKCDSKVELAISYVAGMTDRYASVMAVEKLNWDRSLLPARIV